MILFLRNPFLSCRLSHLDHLRDLLFEFLDVTAQLLDPVCRNACNELVSLQPTRERLTTRAKLLTVPFPRIHFVLVRFRCAAFRFVSRPWPLARWPFEARRRLNQARLALLPCPDLAARQGQRDNAKPEEYETYRDADLRWRDAPAYLHWMYEDLSTGREGFLTASADRPLWDPGQMSILVNGPDPTPVAYRS